jgi:WD40 repeat protein
MLALFASRITIAEEAPPSPSQDYVRAIAQAQEDLDAGRIAEARQHLTETEKSLRGFEYEYLLARADAAPATGPAPDLIRTVEVPNVETRYDVLNGVDRQLACICRDGAIRVYDLNAPGTPTRTAMHERGGAVWSGAFSWDGKTFAAGYESGEVVMWDAKTWQVRAAVPLGEKWPVRELAVAPDGSAVVAESKSALELWSLEGDKPTKVAAVGDRYNFGEGLAFSPQGDLVATGGMFDIVLHDAKTGQRLRSMTHASYTMGLEFSPDGKQIASAPRGNINKFLAVFEVADGRKLFNAGPFAGYVAGLAFTPDGKRIAATGEGNVRLFNASTGEVVLTLKRDRPTARPAVSRDAKLIGWNELGGFRFIDLSKMTEASN